MWATATKVEKNALVSGGVLISQNSKRDWYLEYLAAGNLISGNSLGLNSGGRG